MEGPRIEKIPGSDIGYGHHLRRKDLDKIREEYGMDENEDELIGSGRDTIETPDYSSEPPHNGSGNGGNEEISESKNLANLWTNL